MVNKLCYRFYTNLLIIGIKQTHKPINQIVFLQNVWLISETPGPILAGFSLADSRSYNE